MSVQCVCGRGNKVRDNCGITFSGVIAGLTISVSSSSCVASGTITLVVSC